MHSQEFLQSLKSFYLYNLSILQVSRCLTVCRRYCYWYSNDVVLPGPNYPSDVDRRLPAMGLSAWCTQTFLGWKRFCHTCSWNSSASKGESCKFIVFFFFFLLHEHSKRLCTAQKCAQNFTMRQHDFSYDEDTWRFFLLQLPIHVFSLSYSLFFCLVHSIIYFLLPYTSMFSFTFSFLSYPFYLSCPFSNWLIHAFFFFTRLNMA